MGPQKGPEEWKKDKKTNQNRLIDLNGSLESVAREEDQYREAQVATWSEPLRLNILPREMLDKITEGAEDAAKLGKASKFNRALCPSSRVRLLWQIAICREVAEHLDAIAVNKPWEISE